MKEIPMQPSDPHQQILPLSIQERDGRVTIYCTGKSCMWSWPLYSGVPDKNGRAVTSAIQHVHARHPDEGNLNELQSGGH